MPTTTKITISTPRLFLRGAHLTDTHALHECFRDGEAMLYWNTPAHTSLSQTEEWVQSMLDGPNNGVLDFLICLKDEERRVIGKVGVWHDSEIGFLLHRGYWGQGLAIEAATAVLDRAFGLPPADGTSVSASGGDGDVALSDQVFEDVVADVDPRNAASLKVLGRLGFEVYGREERTLEVGGVWVDSVYLRVRREVWIAMREKV